MATRPGSCAVSLAGQAACISGELYALQERCDHETTGIEIANIGDELAKLSTTLWTLHEAMSADPEQYTAAFDEDLAEITNELQLVFDEINECCSELQRTDSGTSAASWFFKKGRVSQLIKHLEALKGTLCVMRIVLWHGKDYGTYVSNGRLAEENPHTMREDRVILESVLSCNRAAILDLHNLSRIITATRTLSNASNSSRKAGDHHRHLTDSTGIEVPYLPDVLPPEKKDEATIDRPDSSSSQLDRTFSKRGARLGVHMSILDMNAQEAPNDLKHKWINEARSKQGQSSPRRLLTALPELSKISEVESAAGGSRANLFEEHNPNPTAMVSPLLPPVPDPISATPEDRLSYTPVSALATVPEQKGRSGVVTSSIERVVRRLSSINLRSPSRQSKQRLQRDVDSSTSSFSIEGKDKQQDGVSIDKATDIGLAKRSSPHLRRKSLSKIVMEDTNHKKASRHELWSKRIGRVFISKPTSDPT